MQFQRERKKIKFLGEKSEKMKNGTELLGEEEEEGQECRYEVKRSERIKSRRP